jgi:hypothetical protein
MDESDGQISRVWVDHFVSNASRCEVLRRVLCCGISGGPCSLADLVASHHSHAAHRSTARERQSPGISQGTSCQGRFRAQPRPPEVQRCCTATRAGGCSSLSRFQWFLKRGNQQGDCEAPSLLLWQEREPEGARCLPWSSLDCPRAPHRCV